VRPSERHRDRDAFRDRSSERCPGIDPGTPLSTLGCLQFGKSSLSGHIARDVGIRSVRASPEALQLVRFLEAGRPSRRIHALIIRPRHNTREGGAWTKHDAAKTGFT
jgi:hypothetical protein